MESPQNPPIRDSRLGPQIELWQDANLTAVVFRLTSPEAPFGVSGIANQFAFRHLPHRPLPVSMMDEPTDLFEFRRARQMIPIHTFWILWHPTIHAYHTRLEFAHPIDHWLNPSLHFHLVFWGM